MILPNKFKKQVPAKPKLSKYEDHNQVKMFLLSVEDLHTNRFKNGWFTLHKFTEKVIDKPELMDELREFSQNNKIEKPTVEVYH